MPTQMFNRRLRRMEREVSALKCAHERPLGAVRFYRYHVEDTYRNIGEYIRVTATVEEGAPTPPLVQFASQLVGYSGYLLAYGGAEFSEDYKTLYLYFDLISGAGLDENTVVSVDLVSGSPLMVTIGRHYG